MRVAHCPRCQSRLETVRYAPRNPSKRMNKPPVAGHTPTLKCPQCMLTYNVFGGGNIVESGA